MSQGESLHGYPDDHFVYKDEHGTSRIFNPSQWEAVDRNAVAFVHLEILYRQKANPRIWLVLERLTVGGLEEELPKGRYLTQAKAIDWLLDNGKGIPADIDLEDRYQPPETFLAETITQAKIEERANREKLFPKGVPSNTDVVDLVVRIDAAKGTGTSLNQIARELIPGDEKKAKSLLAIVRRMKREGRVNL